MYTDVNEMYIINKEMYNNVQDMYIRCTLIAIRIVISVIFVIY
jgi:hypothetical protein